MSSKRAMKQAQKQAYAKHRSNITNSQFGTRRRNLKKKYLEIKESKSLEKKKNLKKNHILRNSKKKEELG